MVEEQEEELFLPVKDCKDNLSSNVGVVILTKLLLKITRNILLSNSYPKRATLKISFVLTSKKMRTGFHFLSNLGSYLCCRKKQNKFL